MKSRASAFRVVVALAGAALSGLPAAAIVYVMPTVTLRTHPPTDATVEFSGKTEEGQTLRARPALSVTFGPPLHAAPVLAANAVERVRDLAERAVLDRLHQFLEHVAATASHVP